MNHLDGAKAEELVAHHLISRGWVIAAQNWRAPSVEVDIVATRQNCVRIVEVKLRTSLHGGGDGFSAIGRDKLHKLNRAALLWQMHDELEREIEIIVAAVDKRGAISIRAV